VDAVTKIRADATAANRMTRTPVQTGCSTNVVQRPPDADDTGSHSAESAGARPPMKAEISREKLMEPGFRVGDKCTISPRLPRIYSREETRARRQGRRPPRPNSADGSGAAIERFDNSTPRNLLHGRAGGPFRLPAKARSLG